MQQRSSHIYFLSLLLLLGGVWLVSRQLGNNFGGLTALFVTVLAYEAMVIYGIKSLWHRHRLTGSFLIVVEAIMIADGILLGENFATFAVAGLVMVVLQLGLLLGKVYWIARITGYHLSRPTWVIIGLSSVVLSLTPYALVHQWLDSKVFAMTGLPLMIFCCSIAANFLWRHLELQEKKIGSTFFTVACLGLILHGWIWTHAYDIRFNAAILTAILTAGGIWARNPKWMVPLFLLGFVFSLPGEVHLYSASYILLIGAALHAYFQSRQTWTIVIAATFLLILANRQIGHMEIHLPGTYQAWQTVIFSSYVLAMGSWLYFRRCWLAAVCLVLALNHKFDVFSKVMETVAEWNWRELVPKSDVTIGIAMIATAFLLFYLTLRRQTRDVEPDP